MHLPSVREGQRTAGAQAVREGFAEIVSGWTLIDGMDDITDRIERAAEWTLTHGPLNEREQNTIELMIQCQVARGFVGPYGGCGEGAVD